MYDLKSEILNKELNKLETTEDIIGSAIVNRNGLLISSSLPRSIDERKFGAMAAAVFGAIETAASELGNSDVVNNITVEFNDCQLIILGVNSQTILVVLINLEINLGLIFIEIEESIKDIQKILEK